ncbi:MAG: hypothetical protein ACOYOF_13210, partial [Verrucomicrobiaceae bacterium]
AFLRGFGSGLGGFLLAHDGGGWWKAGQIKAGPPTLAMRKRWSGNKGETPLLQGVECFSR